MPDRASVSHVYKFTALHSQSGGTDHSHDYEFEVSVYGPVQPSTGLVIPIVDLDLLCVPIVHSLHNKNLNEHPIFKARQTITTTENIARTLADLLSQGLRLNQEPYNAVRLNYVRVWDDEDTSATYELST